MENAQILAASIRRLAIADAIDCSIADDRWQAPAVPVMLAIRATVRSLCQQLEPLSDRARSEVIVALLAADNPRPSAPEEVPPEFSVRGGRGFSEWLAAEA
jgi:hypothetical protein